MSISGLVAIQSAELVTKLGLGNSDSLSIFRVHIRLVVGLSPIVPTGHTTIVELVYVAYPSIRIV